MANPADAHYAALRDLAQYIYHTRDHGWRDNPLPLLKDGPLPAASPEPYMLTIDPTKHNSLYAYADSDWASCRKNRNAIPGAAVMLAGAAIGYKKNSTHYRTQFNRRRVC